jgi:hypothetical protein
MLRRKFQLLVILASFSLIQTYPLHLESGDVDVSHFQPFAAEFLRFKDKVPTTKYAKHGEVNEFCYLVMKFKNKWQTCGCFVFDKYHVVTSARCLVE